MQHRTMAKIFGDKEDPRRRLDDLFAHTPDPQRHALAWADHTLRAHDVDPVSSEIAAIGCLRAAYPELTLKTARYLVSRLRKSEVPGTKTAPA